MVKPPETRYAKTDGGYVAYQVIGEGPVDLVFTINWFGNVETRWDEPLAARVLERLASFTRLILFDKRGAGLSDPVPFDAVPTLEDWMDDLRAVMDAAGSERAAQLGYLSGGRMSMLFAATHPERTSHLVLFNAFAGGRWSPDNPLGARDEEVERQTKINLSILLGAPFPEEAMSRELDSPGYLERLRRQMRSGVSPGTWEALFPRLIEMDVRPALASIHVPTLVISRGERSGTRERLREDSRYLAERIRDARLVELPGQEPRWMFGDTDALLGEIEEFLTGHRTAPEPERVLATVLFTDVVASTERAAGLGDARWRALVGEHHQRVRQEIARHRGREVSTAGDGFLATFDGPARAIRCARAIVEAVRPLGLEVRAGLHTGEVELDGDDVRGLAVHIGARVSAMAGPGEVLVSTTVKDLVAGSGIEFEDRGEHVLKGVPAKWRIFAARS